eukprot:CAMPEP_0181123046 /NCGR_PEP_ID=MMETSP1071-20121207/25661_1 /TAXON_ID=35127 /ORGANISM="Thalassiosira sp., Strain NH16" /LENGTH=1033 /DNA_ID=CAMNT_0023208103 /DNA_START=49 /DNA_END=3150 /DNA_ORIENTATION=+
MILRFKIAAALLLSSLASNDAFTIQSSVTSRARSTSSRVHASIDQKANGPSPEFYKKMGLSEGVPPQETQQPQAHPPQPQFGQQQPPPQQQQPPPQQQAIQQPPPQQFFDANGNPVSMPMVYDANGNLVPFNPAAAVQQPQAVAPQQLQQPPPPQNQQQQQQSLQMPHHISPDLLAAMEGSLPPKTKGTDDPRPAGFNPDAFTMSNTADVYFAQLKQDSKVRKIARMTGDVETANRVFADDTVRQIGESWNENPHTKEKNLAEARSEIEGTVRMHVGGEDAPQINSGVSYKERLEQMKARKEFQVGKQQQRPKPPVATAPAPPPEQERPNVVGSTQTLLEAESPKVITAPPPLKDMLPKEESPKVGITAQPPPMSVPESVSKEPAPASLSGSSEDEDIRRKTRTLQGLLLKHRGGPGFGAGRLKAPEAQRLEDTLEDVKGILRAEAGLESVRAEKTTAAVPTSPLAESKPAATTPPVVTTPSAPRTYPQYPSEFQHVPPPAEAVAADSPSTQSPPTEDPLASSLAGIEAALKVYKDSSPSEREANLITFRKALMAAASATNRQIIESETNKLRASMESSPVPKAAAAPPEEAAQPVMTESSPAPKAAAAAPKDNDQPMMGFPTTYAVAKPEVEEDKKVDGVKINQPQLDEQLGLSVLKVDAAKVSSLLDAGLEMDEEMTDRAFWAVVNEVDRAEALDKPLSGDVPTMLHHIFDADLRHLLTREQQRTNVTCMQPETSGANRIAMNSIFDDAAHKDLPLMEGRRCEGGTCCDACSRNIFPTFASDAEISLDTFPELASLTFNELEAVSAGTILQFMRLIERVRRTISHEYGVPLSTILPLQAYSRKYVAGTTQQGGGGGEGDFVILHTDEATHDGYHYSCVIYLSSKGVDFEGGDFIFNDPADKGEKEESDDDYELTGMSLEEAIRKTGRKHTPFAPTRGSAVIFSSGWENMHEVEKITSGTRYAVPAFFTTCPVPDQAYDQMVAGKPKTDEDIADDWLHLLLAHRHEQPQEALGRVKELLMKWHYLCTPLSEH